LIALIAKARVVSSPNRFGSIEQTRSLA
jgi:hypothetical protein